MDKELFTRIEYCLKYVALPNVARETIELCKAALSQQSAVTDDMRYAVRFAPSSAHWSERLLELFGPDARKGIDALEAQLREALSQQEAEPVAPQDVEEFIASVGECRDPAHRKYFVATGELCTCPKYVAVHQIRAWMAGHARVPDWYIAAAEKAILTACNNAVEKLNELAPQMGWDSGEVVAEMHIRPLRKLLAASQQEGV